MKNPRRSDQDRAGGGTSREGKRDRTALADWADTFDSARHWVAWTARRRWPDFAAHDDVWAMSVASWWLGPGRGGRDG